MFSKGQAAYFKEYLSLKNSGDNIARLSSSLFESKISLNPHQINAALSFFKNPMRKGVIFADEVGLGKTIEAGLVISQYWYERKRKILIIAPAALIKQWNEELYDKFHLSSIILDGRNLKSKDFIWEDNIYITSINSVYLNKSSFKTRFDLIVIDEAHKLRNVYKGSGIMAPAIKEVFSGQKKLLLTATPFQNNLLELYGLISLIDENIFPDITVFKDRYVRNYSNNKNELHNILANYINRTLRKNVIKYINYTNRNVILADYEVTEDERKIYDKVSNLMYSDDFSETYSTGQSQLIILILQKLLSSSVYAVTSTLKNMKNHLLNKPTNAENIEFDISLLDNSEFNYKSKVGLISNIDDCLNYINLTNRDSKYECLYSTLKDIYKNFEKDENRPKKILIFTESKKTQEYLYNQLLHTEFANVLTFNGDNANQTNQEIYTKWLNKQKVNIQNNKNINMRRAIIDAFENDYEILIATDAAAEGLNMQFCSILINYDLPWNPQKIEQRIGRCHRYGQKNDVIVINLLNNTNSIDKRIYELLSHKLGIFDETFGASDKILGNTEIAKDIEEAIKEVYKTCRTPIEIENAFKNLQNKFKEEIENAIRDSENSLEKYFDEEIVQAFDLQYVEAKKLVNEMEEIFFYLILFVYPHITCDINHFAFSLENKNYTVSNLFSDEFEFCSLNSELGEHILKQINTSAITNEYVELSYSSNATKVGYLDDKVGKTGKIKVSKIEYNSYELNEALVLTGIWDDGSVIPSEICHKLLKLNNAKILNYNVVQDSLNKQHENDIKRKMSEIENYNSKVFKDEVEYIDNWADAMIEKIQLSVQKMREERKEMQINYDFSSNIEEKSKIQEDIHKISKKINKSWLELAQAEEEIEDRRCNLINNLKAEKNKSIEVKTLLLLEFKLK